MGRGVAGFRGTVGGRGVPVIPFSLVLEQVLREVLGLDVGRCGGLLRLLVDGLKNPSF